jgi:outer membrane immunogenic protein
LLYVTGGLAYANINHSIAANPAVFGARLPVGFDDTTTQWGWVLGAGAEWALTSNLSIKSEALVLGFADQNHTVNFAFAPPIANTDQFKSSDQIFVFKTGLNWRFGGGSGSGIW